MYRLCVSICMCLLPNTSGCEQVPGCAVPVQVNICRWNTLCVHIPQGHSAQSPLTPSPCLPRISRGTNAIVKSKTYDPFCDFIFQSPNRAELIKLYFI